MSSGIHLSFDLDGTIVDSLAITVAILNDMIQDRKGTPVSLTEVRPLMGVGGPNLINRLLGTVALAPQQDIAEFRQRYLITDTPWESIYPGVIETLPVLKSRGYTITLCSNKARNICCKILQDLGIDQYFEIIVGGEITHKPHVDHWHAVINQLTPHAQHYYIGDSDIDQAFCQTADLAFVHAQYGYGQLDSQMNVCYTITRFDQLTEIFT